MSSYPHKLLFALGLHYNPHANSSYRWSLDKWESIFSELTRVKLPLDLILITGDANLPGIDWDTLSSDDAYESHIVRLLGRFNLLHVVDFNTTSSKLLDVVAVSSPDAIISVSIDDTVLSSYPFSDHYPISIAISVSEKEPLLTPMLRFSFAHADYASLSALISEFPLVGKCWTNPNVLLEEWHVWLRAPLMLRCIPFKTSHRVTLPPWVSPKSSHLMKKLKNLKTKGAVKPSGTIFQKIQNSETVLSNALETDKADYESKLVEGRSTKHLFKYLKSPNSCSLIPANIHWGNQTAESATYQCELFNYFNSVFSPASTRPEAPSNPVLTDYDISPFKINQNLVGLDVRKSRGPDKLPAVLFKEVPELSLSLSKLFYKIQQ